MEHSQELIKLRGRLQTIKNRCVLLLSDDSKRILLKCPGLCITLTANTIGIEVRSGSTMVDVPCEVTGRYVDDVVPPYEFVFGDISEIIVYSANGESIPLDLKTLQQLSANELADLEYFEGREGYAEDVEKLRQRLLKKRQEW